MARYVVPVVVLLALVGGYVVGQQPAPRGETPNDPAVFEAIGTKLLQADSDGNGLIEGDEFEFSSLFKAIDRNRDGKVEKSEIERWVAVARFGARKGRTNSSVDRRSDGQTGRYVPFEGGKMLDTTNGTLYAMEGNPTQWKVVATMTDGEPPADVELRTIKPQRQDVDR